MLKFHRRSRSLTQSLVCASGWQNRAFELQVHRLAIVLVVEHNPRLDLSVS